MVDYKSMGFSHVPTTDSRLIMIAIDGSEHSKRAFAFYTNNLHQSNDAVTLFHAVEPVTLPSFSITNPSNIPTSEWTRLIQNNVESVRHLETDYSVDCQRHNINFRFLYESVSHIGEAIINQSTKYPYQLLIMGTRGLGAIKRTVLGSVSDYVVHHSKVAVCIVPSNDD